MSLTRPDCFQARLLNKLLMLSLGKPETPFRCKRPPVLACKIGPLF